QRRLLAEIAFRCDRKFVSRPTEVSTQIAFVLFQKGIMVVLGMPLKEYEGGSALSHEHIDAGGLGARQNLISVGGECCLRKAIIAGVRNPPLPRQATYQRMRLRDGLATQNIGNL